MIDVRLTTLRVLAVAGLALLTACGGGGGSTPPVGPPSGSIIGGGTPTPTPTLSPTPTPAQIVVNPQPAYFYAIGAAFAQTVQVTEVGYGGSFSAVGCVGTVSVAAGSTPTTYVVTPVAVGQCDLSFADAHGNSSSPWFLTVTTTSVVGE
jgi:hypothetical protein